MPITNAEQIRIASEAIDFFYLRIFLCIFYLLVKQLPRWVRRQPG